MDRYIGMELLPPFLFGVGAFSSLGVSVGTVFELIRQIAEYGLPIRVAIEVILLSMPQFIVYSFPMSTLLATLTTYSRFSSDSELVAMRGCGVSVYRLILPTVLLCFLVTGIAFAFHELIVPASNYRAATTLARALDEEKPNFQEDNILYQQFEEVVEDDGDKNQELRRIFYAREFDGEEMRGLSILDFSREGLNQIIVARSATWDFANSLWEFFDGTIYAVSADGSFSNIATFEEQQLKLPRKPLDLAARRRDYGEMNIAQSLEYLDLIRPTGNEGKILELQVRIHQKVALPFICVAFGLVGAALGTMLRKTGRATSFAISVVMIFAYYLFMVTTGAIAQVGLMSPFLGAWLPNLFGVAVGVFLLIRAAR
ncbi:MAG: YjgP/YjgQ family permease [Leptolyngbyaceae cyanobacterium SL_7_1]|nr:YjgP/YjgQ family permease [Leptolyngbyaceae cyanobacterium SL_7_1]